MITFNLETPRATYEGCLIKVGYYGQERAEDPLQVAWNVVKHGQLIGTATVNLWSPPVFPREGCVFVKIRPEFEGWLESLEAAKLVERTGRIERAGFVERYAAECRVLVPELLAP